MKARIFIPMIFMALSLTIAATNFSLGQNEQSDQAPKQLNPKNSQIVHPQTPNPVGGSATVIGVDEPEKCLRIRSGPGKAYEAIDCAKAGDRLQITGVWTSNNWAQLANKGWVYGPQIKTDVQPPKEAYSQSGKYLSVKGLYPEYDSGYLPDYGYATYRRGAGPIILYDVDVWQKYHPWWWGRDRTWDPVKRDWIKSPTGSQTNVMTELPPASVTTEPRIPSAAASPTTKSIHKGKGKPRRFVGSAATGFGTSGSRVRFGASGEESVRSDEKRSK
ncbi:MAG: hypothetical protein ACLQPD_05365 [Desulfomonilaceae bacterium]